MREVFLFNSDLENNCQVDEAIPCEEGGLNIAHKEPRGCTNVAYIICVCVLDACCSPSFVNERDNMNFEGRISVF